MLWGRVAVAAVLMGSSLAGAQVFDLRADYSETANPNWQWTFVRGGVPLQKFNHVPGHPLNPAVANGHWGVSATAQYESSVMKTTADATVVGGTANDWLAGDIIAHGTNPGGAETEIRWGGNVAGTAAITGKVWYAHSGVNRIGAFTLRRGNSFMAAETVGPQRNRSNPVLISVAPPVPIAPGEVISLTIGPASGQQFACLLGVELTITFTARTCPADLTYAATLGSPGYLVKNGVLDSEDFFAYLAQYAAGNLALCDLTASAVPGSPGYGTPNGALNSEDFFYYLTLFSAGC